MVDWDFTLNELVPGEPLTAPVQALRCDGHQHAGQCSHLSSAVSCLSTESIYCKAQLLPNSRWWDESEAWLHLLLPKKDLLHANISMKAMYQAGMLIMYVCFLSLVHAAIA